MYTKLFHIAKFPDPPFDITSDCRSPLHCRWQKTPSLLIPSSLSSFSALSNGEEELTSLSLAPGHSRKLKKVLKTRIDSTDLLDSLSTRSAFFTIPPNLMQVVTGTLRCGGS
ncbi:hypothetical protein KSP40_PGU003696 [Platanthera guangdongensis]|uniref:Uncharacterized protein n=1 Tax=Platanthera guangdongensis TaxID=2320717 RepID=A0ABR2LW09_9ASPA